MSRAKLEQDPFDIDALFRNIVNQGNNLMSKRVIGTELKNENRRDYTREEFFRLPLLWYLEADPTKKVSLISLNKRVVSDSVGIEALAFDNQVYLYLSFNGILKSELKEITDLCRSILAKHRDFYDRTTPKNDEIKHHGDLAKAIQIRLETAISYLEPQVIGKLCNEPIEQSTKIFDQLLKFHFSGEIESTTQKLLSNIYDINDGSRLNEMLKHHIASQKGYRISDIKDDEVQTYIDRSLAFLNTNSAGQAASREAGTTPLDPSQIHNPAALPSDEEGLNTVFSENLGTKQASTSQSK
ncbi:MAG: hypothetical protein HOM96_04760 [Rickettsiales bacterium]|jgi:hypothetical protein|nr:hypothetical protein [Rickettsiales bacterium]